MVRRYAAPVIGALLSLTQVAAAYQAEPLTIPWWVWLVAIAVLLLLAFAIILSFDFRDAPGRQEDDNE
jgi:type III secretory pathway component EscS